jgi:hypothetical protein
MPPDMEFLDISLTKDLSLFLHAIHSFSTGKYLKKPILYSGFKNACKKNPRKTRKLESTLLEKKN